MANLSKFTKPEIFRRFAPELLAQFLNRQSPVLSARGIELPSVPKGWTKLEGDDGRVVAVPPDATTITGPDKRTIAVPQGWTHVIGNDNRAVAIPPGGEYVMGGDNRATPLPPDNFDLTDYVTLYCILEAQAESLAEEEADAAE